MASQHKRVKLYQRLLSSDSKKVLEAFPHLEKEMQNKPSGTRTIVRAHVRIPISKTDESVNTAVATKYDMEDDIATPHGEVYLARRYSKKTKANHIIAVYMIAVSKEKVSAPLDPPTLVCTNDSSDEEIVDCEDDFTPDMF